MWPVYHVLPCVRTRTMAPGSADRPASALLKLSQDLVGLDVRYRQHLLNGAL